MRDTYRLPILTAPMLSTMLLLAATAPENMALAQASSPASLEQGLKSQYPEGTVLNVLTTSIVATSGCNIPAESTFKNGKLHPPGLAQNLLLPAAKCEMQSIAPGSQVSLLVVRVVQKSNRVYFVVSQGAIASQVDFDFPKGFLATAELAQVQEAIQNVFAVASSPSSPAEGGQAAPAVSQPASPQLPPAVMPGSLYVNAQNKADRLQMNLDNSFSLQEGGQSFTGNYSVAGATLKLHIVQLQKDVDIAVHGSEIVVNGEEIWTLALGPRYVNSANSADQIQLSADGSFALQEGGQSFTGTYSVAGATLTLHIPQLQKDVDILVQGNEIVVNGEEIWNQPKKASEAPVAVPSTPSRGLDRNPADLQSTIEAGKEVSLPVKTGTGRFNNGFPYLVMAEGVVTLSKTTFAFRATVGADDFGVSPDKILYLNWQRMEYSVKPAMHVKVAVKNKKGTKEDKKDYYFYSVGARAAGGGPNGEGASVDCGACDDSMNVLYALLAKIRGGQ